MPTYEITDPDGKTYEVTGPGTKEEALAHIQAQYKTKQPAPPAEKPLGIATTPQQAATDAALPLLSGAIATPLAGLAGLAQGAKNLFSEGMPAADRVRQVQEGLTYQPQTMQGQAGTDAVSYLPTKYAEGADLIGANVADASGSPAVGAAVNTGIQALPAILAKGGKAPAAGALERAKVKAADLKNINSVRDTTLASAQEAGYVVPPSHIKSTVINNQVESIAGKAALDQEAALRNQKVTDSIGRREAGLAENEPLSVQSLAAAREKMAQPYRDVAALSKTAEKALDDLKETRNEAQAYWKHYGTSNDPKSMKQAKILDAQAKSLESVIEREAMKAGQGNLIADLREARKQMAKNYDVERALNVGDGHLDARVWGRMADKDKPLSGELMTAAKFAEAFPKYVTPEARIPTPGVSKLDAVLAAGGAGLGSMIGGPAGAVAGAVTPMAASRLARTAALSRFMQGGVPYGPGAGVSAMELLTRNPSAYMLGPTLREQDQ
jgi:hypothetical protein